MSVKRVRDNPIGCNRCAKDNPFPQRGTNHWKSTILFRCCAGTRDDKKTTLSKSE